MGHIPKPKFQINIAGSFMAGTQGLMCTLQSLLQ
jgi:hypothetical protein